jgi:hypothetical protein
MPTTEPQPAETRSLTDEEFVQVTGGVDLAALAADLYILTFCVGTVPWGETGTLNKLR